MTKLVGSDILAILQRFGQAADDSHPRHIEQIHRFQPRPDGTAVRFRFQKQEFYIIIDAAADDDLNGIIRQVKKDKPDFSGEVISNPHANTTTHALLFKGKTVYLIKVKTDKQRLDIMLSTKFPGINSRSTWQKYIKNGYVSVNGRIETSSKAMVGDTDAIAMTATQKPDYTAHSLPVLYLDDDVIVIDKPSGTLSHSKGALNDEFTVADFLKRYTTAGLNTNRPGIVHRLDRDTSGVMIGARHEAAAKFLKQQFSARTTKKTYLAIIMGQPKNHEAKIDLPIGRNPASPSSFRVDPGGRPAITYYKVLATDTAHSLIELQPVTGRTHQLRVHMKALGTPVAGDRIYADTPAARLYLHATALEITLPNQQRRTFVSALPPEFLEVMGKANDNDAHN